MPQASLRTARIKKDDEYYTQYADIKKELDLYVTYNPDVFRGKIIYCNCDEPTKSNFVKYFLCNFRMLGCRNLIATGYRQSVDNQQRLFTDGPTIPKGPPVGHGSKCIIYDTPDNLNEDMPLGDIFPALLSDRKNELSSLKGDGDFRSRECIELLEQSDIVVTNPPFSLFRQFIRQLFDYDKKFIILGNLNAITYKDIFPYFLSQKIWLGIGGAIGGHRFTNRDGIITRTYNGTRWYTNIEHGIRRAPLQLMTMDENKKYSKHRIVREQGYPSYINHDGIEVPYTDSIPSDYDCIMGVPISFLDKYSPDQFDLIGTYKDNIIKIDGHYKRVFQRILIRHKKHKNPGEDF